MLKTTALIVFVVLMAVTAFGGTIAFAADPPEGYEWASSKGALKITIQNADVYIFDTYEPLTVSKNISVGWGVAKDSDLTDLGKDLKGRLEKIGDIASVFVGYRVIMFRKFPLSTWNKLMPEIEKALK